MQTINLWREKITALYKAIAFTLKYLRGLLTFMWRRSFPYLKKFHLNAFPSTRLKDFNHIDVALKFSSELVLFLMAAVAAVWNLSFVSNSKIYADKSPAARVVALKPELNRKLYEKMSVINTVVLSQSYIVPKAYAEEFVSVSPENIYNEEGADSFIFSQDAITQPTPDSVSQFLAKQIKVYETKEGDTLKKIAAENGISANTIIWANKLPSTSIKPSWFLVILPTDGILHKAADNDTLLDLAHKYSPQKFNASATVRENEANNLLDKIISYNGLENAEDINPGDMLIIPGGVIPEPPKPKTAPSSSDGKVKPKGSVIPNLGNGTGHIFPKGYCTWYVASKVHVPWGGNAKNWLSNARAMGYTITQHAMPGTIVVTTDNARYGHVAVVESVNEKGFTVSEMNYEKFGKVNTRFISHSSKIIRGFIIP